MLFAEWILQSKLLIKARKASYVPSVFVRHIALAHLAAPINLPCKLLGRQNVAEMPHFLPVIEFPLHKNTGNHQQILTVGYHMLYCIPLTTVMLTTLHYIFKNK